MGAYREEAGPLSPSVAIIDPFEWSDRNITKHFTTTNAWGGITETSVYIYGPGARRSGPIVSEWKKKSKDDEKPYTGTVAHYYAKTVNGGDIGLSVAVKRIRWTFGI